MSMIDKSKFNFSETFNNSNGKTSGSGFIGVILGIIAGCAFIAGTAAFLTQVPKAIEFLEVVLQLVFAVGVLLGVRKVGGQLSDAMVRKSAFKAEITTEAKKTKTQDPEEMG